VAWAIQAVAESLLPLGFLHATENESWTVGPQPVDWPESVYVPVLFLVLG
jgi:hypothetical protein